MPTATNTAGMRGRRQRSNRVTNGASKKLNNNANASGMKTSFITSSTATTIRMRMTVTSVAKRSFCGGEESSRRDGR